MHSDDGLAVMLLSERGHFSNDLEIPLQGPFNENNLAGNDAGADRGEVAVDAGAADDHVDVMVGSEL